jgi:hypothetical protein
MKKIVLMMVIGILLVSSVALGQGPTRLDAIWARNTSSPITLDGRLTEAAWATAESIHVRMGVDNGIPGSGWYWENGRKPGLDPTDAVVKFLARGDSIYMGIICKDKSIGAGLFNQFDGFLMNIRYKGATGYLGNPYRNRSNQANEIFYGWVSETWADTSTAVKGALPAFLGDFASPYVHPRPDSLRNLWDAATTVQGISNSDTLADTSWTTELKFNAKAFGYNVTGVGGDIVQWGIQIYDADYRWPIDTAKVSGNRAWYQSPWGNASAYNHIRIFVRSDVTTSGAVPAIAPDYIVPNANNFPAPVIDGRLNEPVWRYAPSIRIKYGDAAVRNAYANTLKYRSGQFQPTVAGAVNPVLDPNTADVKYFFKADTLFLGFDVNDRSVTSIADFDRWDGFRVIMEQRDARNGDSVLAKRRFTFRVDTNGTARREEDLSIGGWDSLAQAVKVALQLKGGTTIDTVGTSADSGYTAEMKIILPKMGYPAGRGDGLLFFTATHFDGDIFPTGKTGTRTWFGREGDFDDGPPWMYMDPTTLVSVEESASGVPSEFALLGNYPNPFNPSTNIKFAMERSSEVTLEVYDVLGRLVATKSLGIRAVGQHTVPFNASGLASGSYFYRLKMVATGTTLVGKMLLLK